MSAFTLSATHAVAKTAGLRAKTQVRTSFASRVPPSNPPAPLLDRPMKKNSETTLFAVPLHLDRGRASIEREG